MLGKWDGGVVFIDLMAGPGICVDRTDQSEFIGSPLLALNTKKAWTQIYLVELDVQLRQALEQRVAQQPRSNTVQIIAGDSNSAGVIARLRTASEGALAVAFVDLIGQEIAFDTIRQLTTGRSIDLWFSFPELDLRRNATLAPRDMDHAARWTRFFGTEEWRPIVEQRRPRAALVELLKLYRRQLEALGYITEVSKLPMKNSLGATMYRPLFASKNARGIDFFHKSLLRDAGAPKPATLFDLG
ncbi:MAG: three-Cys-motif partner protein TcmP [Acidobacteriota bacterium]|nr:three-Cys-motif partner protein TcmP [Acidobacteriota bacterium]